MPFTRTRGKLALLALPLLVPSVGGCFLSAGPDPAYAEADYVPPDVTMYPHTVYEGQVVYLVDDRWYYQDGPRWLYYRREPEPLARQRPYVQQAPRAHPTGRVEEQRARPVEQRAAPVEQRAAPVEQRAAPVERRAAPVEQRAAPVERRARPEEQRGRRDERQEAPPAERRSAPPATEGR
jgi:hypothetical protein